MAHVQVSRRLVQEQQRRLLGERAGDEEPLALAAGELTDAASGQLPSVRGEHGVTGSAEVALTFALEQLQVRRAAHQDQLQGGERRRQLRILGDHSHPQGNLLRRQTEGIVAVQAHPARLGGDDAADSADEGGLAGAVGPYQAQELAYRQGERDGAQRHPSAVGHSEIAHVERGLASFLGQRPHQNDPTRARRSR